MRSLPVLSVASLLFGSGFSALIYQVAWLRELRLIFGASTTASAAVLAVFMGGLGLGGVLLGRRATTHPRPLGLYASLEMGIALSAAATPLLVALARIAYTALGGTIAMGLSLGTVVRLLFSALILGLPTFLMGGTLPAAAQAVETDRDVGRRHLALLYGMNTLGAVTGTLLSTFALLEILGTRRMLITACAINLLVAMVARAWARRAGQAEAPAARLSSPDPASVPAIPAMPPTCDVAAAAATAEAAASTAASATAPGPALWPAAGRLLLLPLVAAGAVGFVFLLMELVWYRMLGPLLGGSSFTFGLILAVALAGIGSGGVAYAAWGGKARATARGFALTCALEALCLAVPYALGDRIAVWASLLGPLAAFGFGGRVIGWAIVAVVVVFPAAFVAGVQFPLLLAWVGEGRTQVGRQVGLVYAWNTAGAILGSLAGGFGLLPLLTAPGAWRATVLTLIALAAAILVANRPRLRRAAGPVVAALAAGACLLALGPTAAWRHSGIGVGQGPSDGSANLVREWQHSSRRSLIWEADGRESSVALDVGGDLGYAFIVNGKVDGNSRGDAETQVMNGLLGAILHGQVRRAMVVGLGTGSTAGWLGKVPSLERVDVAELEPAILRVARDCAAVNHDVLSNPKVHVFLGDAREHVLSSNQRYQLIASEPSNPYRAGVASLFTEEFYRAVAERLTDDGLLVQWMQSYNVDTRTMRTIYATLAAVFPSVDTWVTQEADLMLVASRRPLVLDVAALRARIAEEPYRSALESVWLVDDVEGLLARFVARGTLAQAISATEGEALNTDDQTLVEFGFARSAGVRSRLFTMEELRRTARERGEDRPLLSGGSVDWQRVLHRRLSMFVVQGLTPPQPPASAPLATRRRARALAEWQKGDCRAALAAWATETPEDPLERVLVAECRADVGDEAVLPLLKDLRARRPVEADGFGARLHLRQGRLEQATRALEAALTAYRRDPWPLPRTMARVLELVPGIAAQDRALGERLHRLLGEPFALGLLDEARRTIRLRLAGQLDFAKLCRDQVAASELWVPWQQQFLSVRLHCYRLVGDLRSGQAERDLARFVTDQALPFAAGLAGN